MTEQIGRREIVKTSAGLGLALAAVGIGAPRLTSAQADIEQEKADTQAAIDEKKTLLETIEGDVTSETQAIYDRLKEIVAEAEEKFEGAEGAAEGDAKRAYREIQHLMHEADHEIDKALHFVGHSADSVWNDLRSASRKIHNAMDHLIDKF